MEASLPRLPSNTSVCPASPVERLFKKTALVLSRSLFSYCDEGGLIELTADTFNKFSAKVLLAAGISGKKHLNSFVS